VCRLYHVLWCIHSLLKCDILMSGDQQFLRVLYIVAIYFKFLLSEFLYLKQFMLSAWSCPTTTVLSVSPFLSPNFNNWYDCSLSNFSSELLENCPFILFSSHFSFTFRAVVFLVCFVLLWKDSLKFLTVSSELSLCDVGVS